MARVERWERRTDASLILLALAFLVAYAVPVIHPDLDSGMVDFFTSSRGRSGVPSPWTS